MVTRSKRPQKRIRWEPAEPPLNPSDPVTRLLIAELVASDRELVEAVEAVEKVAHALKVATVIRDKHRELFDELHALEIEAAWKSYD